MAGPPFRRIGIAGLGLIGGSVALAARRAWPDVAVTGADVGEVAGRAHAAGLIDVAGGLDEIAGADLIVLAAPASANRQMLESLSARRVTALVTDTGSTKRDIVAVARGGVRFVGGHPIAGAETSGFAHARTDLFDGRPWLVTPCGGDADDADAIGAFVTALGARPHVIDAETHDRVLAYVSHLPQIVASALMAVVGETVGPAGLALAGLGLTDTTRLAGSHAAFWRDVCRDNADNIDDAIRAVATRLADTASTLRDDVTPGLALAAQWRAELTRVQPPRPR